jgi:hypothetical protein
MKKMMIALAILGMTYCGAEAQTKNIDSKTKMTCTLAPKTIKAKRVARVYHRPLHTASYVKNHQVCTNEGGYYTCCVEKSTATRKW